METIKKFTRLNNFIKKRSTDHKAKINHCKSKFEEGVQRGYADAFELCAIWIDEILQEAKKP